MNDELRFPGFKAKYRSGFFTYPTELESWWQYLTGADQKVLDFILRRTLGWGKVSDAISLSQFTNGVGSKMNGSGVSRAQVCRSLKKLEEMGFIMLAKEKYKTTVVHLALRETTMQEAIEDSTPSELIVHLINLFNEVAPGLAGTYLKKRKERAALERMLAAYTPETIEGYIKLLRMTNGEPYAPVITSPAELEVKLPKLIMFLQKKKRQEEQYTIL